MPTGLESAGPREVFRRLAHDYRPRPRRSRRAAAAWQADASPENLQQLQDAVEPPRQELFRRLNMAQGGTAALVEMRGLLLKKLKANPAWRTIDADLMHLLRSWFNRGFLRLERVDWHTSAMVLEKLIRYEAVHAIEGWPDLRPPAGSRPALLRVLPSAAARRADHFHRGGADARHERAGAAAARHARAGLRHERRRLRGVLLDHQLPGRPARHFLRQPADQAGGRRSASASSRTCGASPRCRRSRASAAGWRRSARAAKELAARIDRPAWHLGEVPEALQTLLLRLCAYYLLRAKQGATSRSTGGALSPGQRRLARAHQLAGGHLRARHGALRGPDGQLRVLADRARAQPRALLPRAQHRRLAGGVERLAREWR
jgi:hypothetical protein